LIAALAISLEAPINNVAVIVNALLLISALIEIIWVNIASIKTQAEPSPKHDPPN